MKRSSPLRRATPLRRKKPLRVKLTKAKQDRIFAVTIKTRDKWLCQMQFTERCQKDNGFAWDGYVQACHLWGKQAYPAVRYDPENVVTGCRSCHHWAHLHPFEFIRWVESRFGADKFDLLRRRAMNIAPEEEPNDDGSPDDRTPSLEVQRRDALRR